MVHQNSIFVFNGGRALRIDVLSVMFASVENQNVIFALERPDGNRMIGGLIVKHYTFRRLSPEFSAGLRGRINRTNQANLACE